MYVYTMGAYFTHCDAVAPPMSVIIDHLELPINPKDLLYRDFPEPLTGLCMTAITDGGAGPFILGEAFMQNVLTVFDVESAEVRFMSRPYY